MIAPIYGSLTIAHNTGGLKDTVTHLSAGGQSGNGFVFEHFNPDALKWAVDEAMAAHPAALHTLRSTPVPWRRNFPQRRQFSAPVLSMDPPRWVGSVLDDLKESLGDEVQHAVDLFRSTIDAMRPVRAVVEPGRLLIFDNRANLHRGPSIEPDHERRLIRIKLGGEPD